MQLCKFLKVMSIIIIVALAYIHMQMQIVDLAYQGNTKERQIKKLIEDNGSATYKILMLKSANNLGIAMLEEDSDMQFSDVNDIVEITASEEILMAGRSEEQPKLARSTNPLLSLLSFGVEAEAKTAK